MKTICFIENRGKTVLWQQVANHLCSMGYRVCWIVQNHLYSTKSKNQEVAVIPYPKKSHLSKPSESLKWRLRSDRGNRFFGNGDLHYNYYAAKIKTALEDFKPDMVIGESTLFHELLAIHACREKKIPYFHPCATRYPSDRFNLFLGDTQEVAFSSADVWSAPKIEEYIKAFLGGATIPTYMKPVRLSRRAIIFLASLKSIWAYLRGERYNTPSAYVKISLSWRLRQNKERWGRMAKQICPGSRSILYPLQMQPEANLDVWGEPWSNQLENLHALLKATPEDVIIAVKANPKAKYELSQELLTFAEYHSRIFLLPLKTGMDEARMSTCGTITATGTVGLEALLGLGRCLSLGHPVVAKYAPEFNTESFTAGARTLLENPSLGVGDHSTASVLLSRIVFDSHRGLINEPVWDNRCISRENVAAIARTLDRAFAVLAT